MNIRIKKYINEITALREQNVKLDGIEILSVLRKYMPPELERFALYTYPKAWLEALGADSGSFNARYSSGDLSYVKTFIELERVDWYRAETEDFDKDNTLYEGYARSGSAVMPGTHTLYIRSLEIDGRIKHYIGITKNSSKERLEGNRYYMSNEEFHRDMLYVIGKKIGSSNTLSAKDKDYILEKVNGYFAGEKIKIDKTLNINGEEKHYDCITKILDDIGIPETLDVSASLPGWMASFLERLHIDAFSLDTDKDLGYNHRMGGDHLTSWPIVVTQFDESGRPCRNADGSFKRDIFSDLEEAIRYVPGLKELGYVEKKTLLSANGINSAIRRHNERAMRILQENATPKDKIEYDRANVDKRKQMTALINISVDLFIPENEPIYHLLTRFFYEGKTRINAYPLCVMRNGYFITTRYGIGAAKKEYSKRYGLSQAEVDRRIRNGDILNGDKRVCLMSDLPHLQIPNDMTSSSWRSFSRSYMRPGRSAKNIHSETQLVGTGKNKRNVDIYIWEEKERVYWYSDAPGVLMDRKTLASLRGVNDISTEGICMMRGSGEILYDFLRTFAAPQYIDGVRAEDPLADIER